MSGVWSLLYAHLVCQPTLKFVLCIVDVQHRPSTWGGGVSLIPRRRPHPNYFLLRPPAKEVSTSVSCTGIIGMNDVRILRKAGMLSPQDVHAGGHTCIHHKWACITGGWVQGGAPPIRLVTHIAFLSLTLSPELRLLRERM